MLVSEPNACSCTCIFAVLNSCVNKKALMPVLSDRFQDLFQILFSFPFLCNLPKLLKSSPEPHRRSGGIAAQDSLSVKIHM